MINIIYKQKKVTLAEIYILFMDIVKKKLIYFSKLKNNRDYSLNCKESNL